MENTFVYNISTANIAENSEILNLIIKAKKGDAAAFTQIYNLYFKRIYQFIYFRVSHKETAEDLAEDVFLKVYGKLSSLDSHNSFEGWLYQIARNIVIDYYRQKQATVAFDDLENTLEYEKNIIDIVSLDQQQKVFLELLKQLAPEQQIVIKLKFLEDLQNSEIAEMLHKNEGAIRVIQFRAIAKLKELISGLNTGKKND